MLHDPFQRSRKAFTLVEIMAATGIMLIIILLVLSLTSNVLSSWNRSSDRLASNAEARVALNLLQSDLESMIIRNRDICWLEVNYTSVGTATGINASDLYFYAPSLERPLKKSDDSQIIGGIGAIAYQLAYENPFIPNQNQGDQPAPLYGLYRFVVDTENTFRSFLDMNAYNGGSGSGNTLLSEYFSGEEPGIEYYDESGNLSTINATTIVSSENFLSQHIAEFLVIFWYEEDRNNDGTPERYAVTSDGTASGTPESFVYADALYVGGSPPLNVNIVYADVKLTVLAEEGAKLLNSGTISFEEAVAQYGEVFSRRIGIFGQ